MTGTVQAAGGGSMLLASDSQKELGNMVELCSLITEIVLQGCWPAHKTPRTPGLIYVYVYVYVLATKLC